MGFHAIHLWGLNSDVITVLFNKVWLGYLSYAIGVVFYMSRFPERFFPGIFDYFGSSHQIWHCFVIMGARSVHSGLLNYSSLPRTLTCPAVGLSDWD